MADFKGIVGFIYMLLEGLFICFKFCMYLSNLLNQGQYPVYPRLSILVPSTVPTLILVHYK